MPGGTSARGTLGKRAMDEFARGSFDLKGICMSLRGGAAGRGKSSSIWGKGALQLDFSGKKESFFGT